MTRYEDMTSHELSLAVKVRMSGSALLVQKINPFVTAHVSKSLHWLPVSQNLSSCSEPASCVQTEKAYCKDMALAACGRLELSLVIQTRRMPNSNISLACVLRQVELPQPQLSSMQTGTDCFRCNMLG